MTFSITILCHHAECHYDECRILFTIMLNVVMLSVIMLSVVMLSVVAPVNNVFHKVVGYIEELWNQGHYLQLFLFVTYESAH